MNWLLDHLEYGILIAFALASWLKRRADVKNTEQEEQRAREEMADGNFFGADENWHLPPSEPAPSVPPPLTRQAAPPPPPRVDTSETATILQHQQDIQERLQHIKEIRATTTGNAAVTRARVAATGKAPKLLMPGKTSLRDSLRNSNQTRRAIVLREILGPPVGLR